MASSSPQSGRAAPGAARWVLFVAIPAGEATYLLLSGWKMGSVVAPQVTTLGPVGAFHDIRWLVLVPDSPMSFSLALLVALGLRTGFTVWAVREFWPSEQPPSLRVLAWSSLGAAALSMAALALPAGLLFGTAIAALSWPAMAALPAAFLVMTLMAHSSSGRRWWRGLPPRAALVSQVVSIVAMSVAALLIVRLPIVLAPFVAALGGLVNLRTADFTVRSLAQWQPRSRAPVGLAALVGSLVAAVVLVALVFAVSNRPAEPQPATGPIAGDGDSAVLLVAGFESVCCSEADEYQHLADGSVFESFSYAGLDRQGHPIAHGGDATLQDLGELGERMAIQVWALHDRTGRPVSIVAESEGMLVTRAFLAAEPNAPVGRILLLSPIRLSRTVAYPVWGGLGRGYMGGNVLRLLSQMVNAVSPFDADVDGPLARSILHLARQSADPFAGRDVTTIIPLADALSGPLPPAPARVVPATHGGTRGRSDVRATMVEWLSGEETDEAGGWRWIAAMTSDLAAAWRVPEPGEATVNSAPAPPPSRTTWAER